MLVAMWQLGNCQLLDNNKGGVVAMKRLRNHKLLDHLDAAGCSMAAKKLWVAKLGVIGCWVSSAVGCYVKAEKGNF